MNKLGGGAVGLVLVWRGTFRSQLAWLLRSHLEAFVDGQPSACVHIHVLVVDQQANAAVSMIG